MAAGKTTLGAPLAASMNLSFCDLDAYIEENTHKTISQIFADSGADAFRLLERDMLHKAAEKDNVVISAGGGTPLFYDNMDFMNSVGTTIFLDASEPVLLRRLLEASATRPLVAGKSREQLAEFIHTELASRRAFYEKCKYTICADKLESLSQIQETVDLVKKLLTNN